MDDNELLRYSRHIFLDDFDVEGQQKLLDAHAVIVGAGGLGCPAAMYLASSGVGQITLVDDDQVELSNLQRQIGHNEKTIGLDKVSSLQQSLQLLNSNVDVNAVNKRLDEQELSETLKSADVVLDCTDNFSSRFLLNKVAFQQKVPLVSGAAISSEGQLICFDFRDQHSPCYHCLYSDEQSVDAPNCSETGVLAAVVGIVASMQALEAIKVITGFGQLQTTLKVMDFKYNMTRELTLNKDPSCDVCSG